MIPTAVISARGEERLRRGHPWIYQSDVLDANAEPGSVVELLGPRQRYVGRALYSDRSQITLRMLTRGEEEIDAAFWAARLGAAIRFRQGLDIDATAYRLVHGEADLLPSLIVDRYADILVVQALSQGMDRHLPDLLPTLVELTGATGVLARNDPRVRVLEGLEQRIDVLYGEVPERILVQEGGVQYDVDPRLGQKTGLFLDQRENREAAARYARGRVLDCFCTTADSDCGWRGMPKASSRWTSPRTPSRGSHKTRRATGSATSRLARRTCSTNCGTSRRPVRASTPSCSIRQPSPRTRPRSKGRLPATRTSTCGRCGS